MVTRSAMPAPPGGEDVEPAAVLLLKVELAVVMPSDEKPRLRATATVFKKTSGITTAAKVAPDSAGEPRSRAHEYGSSDRRRPRPPHRDAGSCHISVPTASVPSREHPACEISPEGWRGVRGRRAPR